MGHTCGPPPEVLKDACGFIVPAHVAPAFAAASEIGKVCRDLDQIGKRVDELAKGSSLKITIAKWYTPNGLSINEHGIKPTIEVPRTDADFEHDLDPQLEKALEIIKSL